MDRFTAENRLVITFEGLTDDLIRAEVTKSINDFLGMAEGVTPLARQSVPCIWRAIVKNEPLAKEKAHIEKMRSLAVNQLQGQQPVGQNTQHQQIQAPQQQAPQQQAPQQQVPQQQAPQQQAPQQQSFQSQVPQQQAPRQQDLQLTGNQPANPAAQPAPLDLKLRAARQQLWEAQQLMQRFEQDAVLSAGRQLQEEKGQFIDSGQHSQHHRGDLQQQLPGLRRRLDPEHHESRHKALAAVRPYTPEQLDKMMNMLLEVAERYHKEDVRLYYIMTGYYEKIREERRRLDPEAGVSVMPPGGFF